MADLGTIKCDVNLKVHVFMYCGTWRIIVDDIDAVEPIAEQMDAIRLGVA